MAVQQITASDITGWDSLQDIATSFEKRGLKPLPDISDDNRLVLELADGEFIELVQAGTGKSATDYKPKSVTRHTNLVATDNYETFTFITRVRDWDAHGRIKYQQFSFEKDQFRHDFGEKHTILQKLNEIEYGQSAAVMDDLYDTRKIVKEFYEQFESLRIDLMQKVDGIPEDRGDAKQRYVQVLLDRMIFLYFIQEKNLLDYDADYLHNHHERVAGEGGDVYVDFYDPLFFDLLAEGKNDPEFGKLPYLNGGLFSKNPIEEEFENAKLGESTEETNELFGRILDFFSDWNWNVDERLDIVDPKNLSPAVLGHIFEQTVNQKEMGAYYTPEEITGFMARRTIHPYLLNRLNEAEGTDYESIDDIFSLDMASAEDGMDEVITDGGMLAHEVNTGAINQNHVETLYFDVLKEARVLDPAVGSGAFLLAAQEVLLDVYLQCIEFFVAQEENEPWELTSRIKNEIETIQESRGTEALYAKHEIILSNLYGVDIDDGAVEICKLRLWLSMVADIEDEPNDVSPLPNIDFNIRQGNSLIGFTEVVERNSDGDAQLSNYGGGIGDSVRQMYNDVIEAVENHQQAETSQQATNWRNIAETMIRSHSEELDGKIFEQFRNAGVEKMSSEDISKYHPFHWVLEFATVYREGGFDVIIGNPPWDQVQANPNEFFVEYDPIFPSLPSKEKERRQENLLEEARIQAQWKKYETRHQREAKYYKKSGAYELQQPIVGGTKQPIPNDLSALFFERVFDLANESSYVSLILPNVIFSGAMGKDLRMELINDNTVEALIGFENKGIFSNLHQQYKFGIVAFRSGGQTNALRSIGMQHNINILKDVGEHALDVSSDTLIQYSPEARSFPNIRSKSELKALETIIEQPPIGEEIEDKWRAEVYYELRKGYDNDRYTTDSEIGEYPVYEGGNFYQFSYDNTFFKDIDDISLYSVEGEHSGVKSAKERIKGKNIGKIKKALYEQFDGSGSQVSFANKLLKEKRGRELENSDVKLDCSEYRLVYRKISNPTNERTVIATVLPKGIPTLDSVYTLRPFKINLQEKHLTDDYLHGAYERVFTDRELFVALGLCNCLAFDFVMRTKDAQNLLAFRFEESQMPRLTDGDNWFHYISERAARLNCYGEAFAEMRERLGSISPATDEQERCRLQAEIDAAAFHAYGLNRQDTEFILDDFHRVRDPRMMTEGYFDLVFEKYNELAETGPHP